MASIAKFFFILLSLCMLNSVTTASNVTAIFAFGDSTVDSGNNNHFNTLFRSDHLPYGRDFPTHLPTGSFACGGAGLDPNTVALAKVFGLSTQYGLFEQAMRRISSVYGEEKATNIVENALFVISIGTNDMLYNVYLSPVRITRYGSISSYQDFMLQNLDAFIQRLYAAGARRILVAGLPPIGCLPIEITLTSMLPSQHWLQRLCNIQQNLDSKGYNNKLQSHIHLLQSTLTAAKIAYFDIYKPILDMVRNPAKYGFEETVDGCCGTGLLEMGPVCNIMELTCPDSSKYLFWDAVHLTEAGNYFLAQSGRKNVLPYLTN
uniref:GDSL esterase/lipase At2g40250 family n=1 Tax=Cajanus cajan TaxID=3821 RepID=A0A151U183_CAJCA|nr:GDSL esterase/lipase At2g40250 family [Cajanus cajan]